ncbi:MAG: family 20 glycosylhydrolase [Clostridia bacterium]|nr:family 20 glycosylhydrolase [Clostridia bacterium]MBQ7011668.1 family 20 glycosylhydrolase [Clostridia bacterium]
MRIVPRPQKMTISEDFITAKSFRLEACCEKGKKIFSAFDCGGDVCVKLEKAEYENAERYEIKIDEKGVSVKVASPEAAFRAATTLKQIVAQSGEKLPCLEIEDEPSIKVRGYMLDISRGKIPNVEYVKQLCDLLADLKYNHLQLYMDSFVYEYKGFEDYWKDCQPLTEAEIKELVAYCKERFIELVPIQNSFGHMAAWTAKEEIAPLAITGKDGKPSQTLNPLLPETLEFLDRIYSGMMDAFDTDLFNIGMDETVDLGNEETKEECDAKGVGRVYTEYLNKVCDLVTNKYKKTPMFFDDIVFKHPEELANIPKNAVVMQWGYEGEQQFDRNCRMIKEHGLRFFVCPGTSMWGSITGRMNNAVINICTAAECGNYYGAEGFLLTEWGDDGHPQFPANTYFPLVYGGYVSWNCGNHRSEPAYAERRAALYDCRAYLDKFVYKCEGEKSLADIVYRMGNFYLLEDLLYFNGTELNQCFMRREPITPERAAGFERVLKYMQGMRAELDGVKADETMLREVTLNCDMVIMLANLVLDRADKQECARILAEYRELWLQKNHEAGINLFPDLVKGWLE